MSPWTLACFVFVGWKLEGGVAQSVNNVFVSVMICKFKQYMYCPLSTQSRDRYQMVMFTNICELLCKKMRLNEWCNYEYEVLGFYWHISLFNLVGNKKYDLWWFVGFPLTHYFQTSCSQRLFVSSPLTGCLQPYNSLPYCIFWHLYK